jgi:hypothetical protein
MAMPSAMKRYTRRLFATILVYVLTLVAVNWWFRHAPPAGALAYVAGVLPALPIAAIFVVIGRLFLEMQDEYVRMLLIRQSLVATGFALSVATGWGFLEEFGLVPHVAGYWVAVLWFSGLGLGGAVNAWLERSRA